jgi:hypothetical protein
MQTRPRRDAPCDATTQIVLRQEQPDALSLPHTLSSANVTLPSDRKHSAGYSNGRRDIHFPSLTDLARFAFFSGLTLLAAWIAGTGRVGYTLIMLVIAAALAFAVLELVDYEVVKKRHRG